MHKTILSVIFVLAFLSVVALSLILNGSLTISDGIYAITGLILLWYSYETARMRAEMTKQNKMQMRPAISLRLTENTVFYKNDGTGPALNVRVASFEPTLVDKPVSSDTDYEIQPVPYLMQGGDAEMIIRKLHRQTGIRQDIPDTDMFFGVGKKVHLTILYQDIEGTEYVSTIATKIDHVSDISLKVSRQGDS